MFQEIYKLRGGIIPSTIENDSDKLSSELSKCRISADIQENKISELERQVLSPYFTNLIIIVKVKDLQS